MCAFERHDLLFALMTTQCFTHERNDDTAGVQVDDHYGKIFHLLRLHGETFRSVVAET